MITFKTGDIVETECKSIGIVDSVYSEKRLRIKYLHKSIFAPDSEEYAINECKLYDYGIGDIVTHYRTGDKRRIMEISTGPNGNKYLVHAISGEYRCLLLDKAEVILKKSARWERDYAYLLSNIEKQILNKCFTKFRKEAKDRIKVTTEPHADKNSGDPVESAININDSISKEPSKTLRDEFAMAVLSELIISRNHHASCFTIDQFLDAEFAYLYADCMLKAREIK